MQAVGASLRSQPVRIASAAVVVLSVLKVFFIDMHDLTGIYQAVSFIGLGTVLMGIGWFYQRLGGINGDCLGFTEQVLEIFVLVMFTCGSCRW